MGSEDEAKRDESGGQASIEEQVEAIMYGAEFGDHGLHAAMAKELHERLVEAKKEGRPLRVYAGYDPSKPDLHLGHSITMRKLRQFQDFGHNVVFLVGTFTAQVGDTSDKLTGRPRKSAEDVMDSARTYAEQCYRILDRDRTTVAYNADWLSQLNLADFVSVASNFTVQQFMGRDNFRRRLDSNNPIGLHEFFYALLQGYDAIHLLTSLDSVKSRGEARRLITGRGVRLDDVTVERVDLLVEGDCLLQVGKRRLLQVAIRQGK